MTSATPRPVSILTHTTAELRTLAWDAKERGEWRKAERLYRLALAAYRPTHVPSALREHDIEQLTAYVNLCASMARVDELEALVACAEALRALLNDYGSDSKRITALAALDALDKRG